jgi:hypothetical protein
MTPLLPAVASSGRLRWQTLRLALTIYGAPPRAGFPESITNCLSDVAVLPGSASLLATDGCAGLVLELDRTQAPIQ